jgi:hypothetical protein
MNDERSPDGGTRNTRESQELLLNRVQVRVLLGALEVEWSRKLKRTQRRFPKPEDEGSNPSRDVVMLCWRNLAYARA